MCHIGSTSQPRSSCKFNIAYNTSSGPCGTTGGNLCGTTGGNGLTLFNVKQNKTSTS
jgi:hypothetical protein